MARRGFLAEMNHQARLSEQRQARAQREADRRRAAAIREAERTRREADRTEKALQRATDAERKRLEKEAKDAHLAAMEARVVELNTELESTYSDIDSLLEATLGVDDYVDLNSLRTLVAHPPFDRTDLERPHPHPTMPIHPKEPPRPAAASPHWLRVIARKKHQAAVAQYQKWLSQVTQDKNAFRASQVEWERAEEVRIARLRDERGRYERECRERESQAESHNRALDELIANLGYGTPQAVEEYVSIVLSNSVYPPAYTVDYEYEFDVVTAELRLRVIVPAPGTLPIVKAYRYQRSSDEIVASNLPAKAYKDRYAGAVHQTALRTLHEVFEADRRGLIKTVSLQVSTATVNPATGNHHVFCLVSIGVERRAFLDVNLENAIPEAALVHLGADISKSPYDLVGVNPKGVRKV